MAERGTEAQRAASMDAASKPPHIFIHSAPCECCDQMRITSIIVANVPPPWVPGAEELEATGTDNFGDLWLELIRMQQQANADPICGECEEVLRGLCDGEN